MGQKIVLLEFVDEARSFLDYCKNQAIPPDSFHIIALQPEVQIYLKKLGIPYENTFRYFSNPSHARALLQSEEWYQFMAENVNLEAGTEIKETYNNTFLFHLRLYMHHFLLYIEILSSICEKHEVESIHACIYQNDIRANDSPVIQDDERYVGILAEKFSQNHGIVFQEIPTRFKSKVVLNNKSLLSGLKETTEKMLFRPYEFLLMKHLGHKNVILLTSMGYNIGNLLQKLKGEFPASRWAVISNSKPSRCIMIFFIRGVLNVLKIPKTSYYRDAELPIDSFQSANSLNSENLRRLEKEVDIFIEKLKSDWFGYFTYNDVDFTELISEKIQKDLKFHLIRLHRESGALGEIVKALNVKLVISPYARETSLMLGELCQNLSIPALMISHGTVIRPVNELERIEYYHLGQSLILSEFYNYTAIQTPSEEKHFHYYHCNNIAIKTGPLIFSKPDLKQKERLKKKIVGTNGTDRKILLYPENIRERFNIRFHVFQTFDEFLSSSIDLVKAINEINDVHLVIRLHPGRKLTPAEFGSLLPESDKLTIASAKSPFFEILSIADLLINFSSTVIEDALQSHIPVLLYDKGKRYMHFEAEELGRGKNPEPNAVYYLSDTHFLKDGLQWILDNHLKKVVSSSIFDRYVFQEDYFSNLVEFISSTINE